MDIRRLELFLAVMESSSVTRAAERVHLSPGAVSLQLHNLAAELHTELFARSGKRLIPTPAALRLAEHASTVIKQMRRIQQEFENNPLTDTRPFHFATGVTTLVYRLGRPLRLLRKQYPKTEIRVTVGVTEEIAVGLIDRRFDLGLITLPVSVETIAASSGGHGFIIQFGDLGTNGTLEVYCRNVTRVMRNGVKLRAGVDYTYDSRGQKLSVPFTGATTMVMKGATSLFALTGSRQGNSNNP